MCPAMRFHTVARIRLKLCGNSLRVTESCMGYLILRAGLHACARRVHALHACTHMHIFSPKLVETFLGSQKRARHNLFVCARLRVHAMRVGARTCAHVCVSTFLDVFAPKCLKTSLCMCYMLFTCARECAHNARIMRVRALHACARSHIIGRILSQIDGDIPWVTDTGTA
jgi:hypothetical protein